MENKKKIKKYKVSLALKVYSNFEIEVSAQTRKKALSKALARYHNGKYDENNITEPDWDDFDLDIMFDDIDHLDSGICIEEVEHPRTIRYKNKNKKSKIENRYAEKKLLGFNK